MNILLVEDVTINRVILKNVLQNFNCVNNIDEAKDGIEAIEKIIRAYNRNNKYDIIFLDIIMPMQSGYHVLEQIKKYEKNNNISNNRAKIITISSLDSDEEKNKSLKMGADEAIIKPITYNMVKDIFQKWGIIEKE